MVNISSYFNVFIAQKKYLFTVSLLIFACAVLFFAHLQKGDLSGESEGNYAEIPREMLQTGDWVIPQLNFVPYLEKPPLFYWLTAMTYCVLGLNAFAARFWSALPALLLVLMVFAFVRRARGASQDGLRATTQATQTALILATSAGMIAMARISYMDMLLCLCTAGALFCFYLGEDTGRRGWYLGFFAAAGLAVLTKGLIGVVLPALAIFFYLLAQRRFSTLKQWPWGWGLLLFFAITVPWHVMAGLRNDRFTWFYFVNEHWLRFLGRRMPKDYYGGSFYYQFLRVLLLFFPWSLWIPLLTMGKAREFWRDKLNRFLISWFLAFLFFYTVSKAKANYYMMPALPALAMLVGTAMGDAFQNVSKRRAWLAAVGAILLTSTGFYALLAIFPYPILKKMAPGSYAFLLSASFCLTGCLLGALVAAWRGRANRSFGFVVAGVMVATFLTFAQEQLFERRGSVLPLVRLIQGNEGADTLVVLRGPFEKDSHLAFYRGKRFTIVSDQGDVGGDLDFGSRFPASKPYFLQWPDFLRRFGGPEKILYVTTKEDDYGELRGNHPTKCRLIGRIAYRLLISNFPPKAFR